ncbi:MAG: insulinase family protein, partial [Desulfobacterales bacterium]|nr:insulinase family protein [Desulfobacterales bacterium]
MNYIKDTRNPGLAVGQQILDYRIEKIELLKEISAIYYALTHLETGAPHIHISRSDNENTFSVAFKTVPKDSSGVAHILEHTVLCGSQKFPVRDPFFSMLKRSLSTFMNAFTASDWTMYPFSTQNPKDFYNLMEVYLDAAFFPKLDPLSFKQEGHRLEIEKGAEEQGSNHFGLVFKGVVYNEMKGAMSSPDQVMARSILKALYPETTYRYNSGGEPAVIPTLTYEQLKTFHREHYHPSNAFFYTYGNLPLKEHLEFIQEKVLRQFNRVDPDTEVASQPRWRLPQTATYPYPFNQNEDSSQKCQVCLAWLTADIKNSFEILALTLLEQILLGNSASPLRKALIDSGLGSALCDGCGFDADNRDSLFVSGLKDVDRSAAEQIEAIIFDVLNQLVDRGIDQQLIDSAIHQIEFHRKEITNTPYPYGIRLLLTFSGSWFHGGDPLNILNFNADLAKLHTELEKGGFFETQIRNYFLDNPHRILLTLVPNTEMEQTENTRVRAELDRIKKDLSQTDIDRIKQDAEALQRLQETEEDVSVLPTLQRRDIPASVPIIEPTASETEFNATIYRQPTSGIVYFAAAAGAGSLKPELVPLAPFFCYSLPRMGTARRDYAEIAQLIDAYTGGIGMSTHSRVRFDSDGNCIPFISFNGKCLVRNQKRMFDIIQELLHNYQFSDLARLRNLLLEYRSSLESMVIHNGHRLAISLASRRFSTTRALGEIWSGVHQLQFIKQLTDNLDDEKLAGIAAELAPIGKVALIRNNFRMALIGEDTALDDATAGLSATFRGLARGDADGFTDPDITPETAGIREGWSTSSAVSFVALAFETVRMEHRDAPALSVISKILRSLYLHREIREKGGA